MSSKHRRGGHKEDEIVQNRLQVLLSELLKHEDNKYCVDCDSKGPRWSSWDLGLFLCIRCAGIHRNLGVHISRVKSVNLDSWTPSQLSNMQQMGNSRGRAVYEANLPANFQRPQSDQALEQFIRAKYEKKKYIAREYVPSKTKEFPDGWFELKEAEKQKKDLSKILLPISQQKQFTEASANGTVTKSQPTVSPSRNIPSSASSSNVNLSDNSTSCDKIVTISSKRETVSDLLGLDLGGSEPSPPSVSSSGITPSIPTHINNANSTQNFDMLSQLTLNDSSNNNQTHNTSGVIRNPPGNVMSTKESILALYDSNDTLPTDMLSYSSRPLAMTSGGLSSLSYPNMRPFQTQQTFSGSEPLIPHQNNNVTTATTSNVSASDNVNNLFTF